MPDKPYTFETMFGWLQTESKSKQNEGELRGEFTTFFKCKSQAERDDVWEAWRDSKYTAGELPQNTQTTRRTFKTGDSLDAFVPADNFSVTLLNQLGLPGGQAVVFSAEPSRKWVFQGPIAVKIYRSQTPEGSPIPTRVLGDRLFQELDALRGISHPNVVSVQDACRSKDGVFWIALEHVPGLNLREWRTEHRKRGLMQREAAALIGFYGVVLAELQRRLAEAPLIHGDIKESNLLGLCDKAFFRLSETRLADFGTALPSELSGDPRKTKMSQYGTPGNMAPEQFTPDERENGKDCGPDAWCRKEAVDVFGLAMTFLALISPKKETEFVDRVGANDRWQALHRIWNPSEVEVSEPRRNHSATSAIDLFKPLLKAHGAALPDKRSVRLFFTELDLDGLVQKLVPGDSAESNDLRDILKACLETEPTLRVQTPGEMARLLAAWLAGEDIDHQLETMLGHSNKLVEARRDTFLKKWHQKHKQLWNRYCRWGHDTDAAAIGALAMVPGGLILLIHACVHFFANTEDAIVMKVAASAVVSTIGTVTAIAMAAFFCVKQLRTKVHSVASAADVPIKSQRQTPADTRKTTNKSSLFVHQATSSAVKAAFGLCGRAQRLLPILGLMLLYVVMWPLARYGAGSEWPLDRLGTDRQLRIEMSRIGDVAQFASIMCLFGSAATFNQAYRWMFVPTIVALVFAMTIALSTRSFNSYVEVISNHLFHSLFMLYYAYRHYVVEIRRMMRGDGTVLPRNASSSPAGASSSQEVLDSSRQIVSAVILATTGLERDGVR